MASPILDGGDPPNCERNRGKTWALSVRCYAYFN